MIINNSMKLYQDVEGLIEVTEVGQRVGLIKTLDGIDVLKQDCLAYKPKLVADSDGNLCVSFDDDEILQGVVSD